MKKRRGYFKHFNDASIGDSIGRLLRKRKFRLVCLFWYFCELANQKDSPDITINLLDTARKFGSYPARLREELQRNATQTQQLWSLSRHNNVGTDEEEFDIFLCNYLEYQDLRSTNNPRKVHESAHIKDKRLKIKDKRAPSAFSLMKEGEEVQRLTPSVESRDFVKAVGEENISYLNQRFPGLSAKHELKRMFIQYAVGDDEYFPKSEKHWTNVAIKWFERRAGEVDALRERGLREVWGDSGEVQYHRCE